jgi:hypothetical protein
MRMFQELNWIVQNILYKCIIYIVLYDFLYKNEQYTYCSFLHKKLKTHNILIIYEKIHVQIVMNVVLHRIYMRTTMVR